jgi:CBS domain-containing protein
MRVAQLMKTDLATVAAEATLNEAIMVLVDAHVLGLPVLDQHGAFVGVLSGSDVLEALAEKGRGGSAVTWLEDTQVRELMTPRPQFIAPEDEVKKAAQEMLYLGIHRVFVVSDDQLVGVISQSDVVQAFANGAL